MYRRSQNFRPPYPAATITITISGSLIIINNSKLYIFIKQSNSNNNNYAYIIAEIKGEIENILEMWEKKQLERKKENHQVPIFSHFLATSLHTLK